MAKIISKIILVIQIFVVVLPLSGLVGFASLFLTPLVPILQPILFIYDSLANFLAVMLPLFVVGAILAYFAKSRGLLYGAVLVLFIWSRRFYGQF